MIIGSARGTACTAGLVVGLFFWVQGLSLLFPGVFELWNARFTDQLFRLRGDFQLWAPSYDETVVHLDINNTTIRELNDYYLNRGHYARVVENLARMQVALQGYDFIFAARSHAADDLAFIEATRSAGNVYFGVAFTLRQDGAAAPSSSGNAGTAAPSIAGLDPWPIQWEGSLDSLPHALDGLPTFPELASVSQGMGFLNVKADRDGVFRRTPLLIRLSDGFYPSLPFRIACDYLGVSPGNIHLYPRSRIVLAGARKPGEPPRDVVIPIDERGNMVINFVGPWEAMRHYNFSDVYHAAKDHDELALWTEELQGRIVLVSDVSTGSTDLGPVPTDSSFPLSGLHANVIHTILTGNFIHHLSGVERRILEAAVLAAVLCVALRLTSYSFPVAMLALSLAFSGGAAMAFLMGQTRVEVAQSLIFMVAATLGVSVFRYVAATREREVIRKTFEAYFSPSVLQKVMQHPEALASRAERKELTVLFSDIKDFTLHSSKLSPDQIRAYLNEYFETMVEIVFRHGGTVDKYLGDGLMAFFGDPEPMENHAARCVLAAVEMQAAVGRMRPEWLERADFPLEVRIGVHTGEVVVGNMGSSRRWSYTVLGKAVNLTQRLEAAAPPGGILLSAQTAERLGGGIPLRYYRHLRLKGITEEVLTYLVVQETDSAHGSSESAGKSRIRKI